MFKQRTEYEMRISAWSSDVCSSDLLRQVAATLHSLAYPAALATGGPGAAELRLLSVNGAFMEATGRDAAALAGHGLAELREAKLCPRPGSNGRTIEARPLYDRNGRRRH